MTHANLIRLGVFAAVLIAMALWEVLAPRRPRSFRRTLRWPANLGISVIGVLAVRVILPLGAIGFARSCDIHRWGALKVAATPQWLAFVITIVTLDLAIYLQHVMFHALPMLWRVHRMHHTDLDLDVTSGVRFHPIESAISIAIKLGAIATLGASAAGVLGFEVLLNASSLFNHSNVAIAPSADALLRLLIVTPDMHRVHHSILVGETNSNFGFNLPWWDRLFRTYRAQPAAGHLGMTIGVDKFRSAAELGLVKMLVEPWRGSVGEDPGQ